MSTTISDVEKSTIESNVESSDKEYVGDHRIDTFTFAEQKNIVHRVDRRLVFTLGILYCISLVDRTNLGSAAIAG
jgi:hypothetical protein